MATQYYNITGTGQMFAVDTTTGIATQVGSIPYGAATVTWTGAGLPPALQNATGGTTATPAPIPTSSSGIQQAPGSAVPTPGKVTPPLPASAYSTVRAQMQSGQISPQTAQQQLQSMINSGQYSGTVDPNQLYAPMTITQNGQTYNLTPSGTLQAASATINQTTVGQNGNTTSSQTAGSAGTSAAYPSQALQPGDTGASVTQLQNYLVANGYMTQAQMDTGPGTYGPQTTQAVAALQAKLGVNNSSGVGYWGPQTLAAVQAAPQGGVNSGTGTATSSGGTNSNGTIASTGDTSMDAAQTELQSLIQNLATTGQIPSGLQITPALVQQFMTYAQQVVSPQTQQFLTNQADSINNALAQATTTYQNEQGQAEQDFGVNLASQDNTMAGSGVAFSGQRNLADLNLANTTNRNLSTNAANANYSISNLLQTGGAALGSANAGLLNVPTGLTTPTVSTAGGQYGSNSAGGGINFNYNPSSYTVGSIPTSQNTALNNLVGNYETQYSTLAANNSGKSINDLLGMMTGLPSGYTPFAGSTTSSASTPNSNLM